MLLLFLLLILIQVPHASSIQCFGGNLTVIGGEISLEPLQQLTCNTNTFCMSYYANNGDTRILTMGCDNTYSLCNKTGTYIDNTTVKYDARVFCCDTDFCNNLTVNTPIRRSFPSTFMFGTATAAYQVEGGAFSDGKGPNIWDIYTRRPGSTPDNSTGDIACNSYEKYATDVSNVKYMGLNHYRFSLSWTRMFPDGRTDKPNEAGILYYDKLINLTLAQGIEPMVTLFHWDMPQSLMDIGGFLNSDIKHYFANYSQFVFEHFGDRVKKWITLNEPLNMAQADYCGDMWADAPGEFKPHCAWTLYRAAHNMLLSHLEMSRVYKTQFQAKQNGIIGLSLNGPWYEPYKNLKENEEAQKRAYEFWIGWLAHPLFSPEGDYSDILKERIANLSLLEKRVTSRLPEFTQDEIEGLRTSADFIGCNYYDGNQAMDLTPEQENDILGMPQEFRDAGVLPLNDPDWTTSNPINGGPSYTPWTLRELLNYFRNNYGNKPVYITENGCTTPPEEETLNDQGRIHFLRGYLSAIAAALEDGCNIQGYTVWSLMDDFEWSAGYTTKYGLYYVDFKDPNRKRIAKASVEFYRKVVADRYVDGF